MFTTEMLPADYGDCLWIEYGSKAKPYRILIDTGTPGTFSALKRRIEKLPRDQRSFELLVISHVDDDHIGGVLRLMEERESLGIEFRDVWFNGYLHLEQASDRKEQDILGAAEDDLLGPVQGERLTVMLAEQKQRWNSAFHGQPIMVSGDEGVPSIDVRGLTIRVLSPGREQLTNLLPEWKDVVIAAGLVPGQSASKSDKDAEEEEDLLGEAELNVEVLAGSRFKEDTAIPNGSSIALLAEYEQKTILLGADAFPSVILSNLKKLETARSSKLKLDALKLPHHGSRANTSPALLAAIECSRFLVSTSGKKFRHPHRETIARAICSQHNKIALCFNYRNELNEVWNKESLMQNYNYDVLYPESPNEGLTIEL